MSEIDQQFIEYVVKSLVGKPDAVKVERRIDEKGVLLELTVDPEDLGRVIGKRGATAQSLRTLLRALGTKNDARYNLKIVDNGVGGHQRTDAPDPSAKDDAKDDSTASDDSGAASEPQDVPPAEKADDETAEPVQADTEETPAEASEEKPEDKEPDQPPPADDTSDRLAQTRQELADLDDLDV